MVVSCSPQWDYTERRARRWATRHGLVAGDEDTRRLARMGQGRMVGWLVPHAGPAELGLLAEWGAFVALSTTVVPNSGRRFTVNAVAAISNKGELYCTVFEGVSTSRR